MKKTTISLTVLLLSVFNNPVLGQRVTSTIESISGCVAFLNDTKIDTTTINGVKYEIFLRNTASNKLTPKIYHKFGTGFFVHVGDVSPYLVTCEHVAKLMTLTTDVVIRGDNDNPIVYKLRDITYRKDSLNWTVHTEADVATLLLDMNSKIFKESQVSPIPLEEIDDCVPLREREITVIGFPLALGYDKHFSPISKISKPSSGLLELRRFDNGNISSFFLLDDPSISGFSGSPALELPTELVSEGGPVFVKVYRLMGLVHGSISEKNGRGFTAVVPSRYILETLGNSPTYSGIFTWYHDNGRLWSEREYRDGKPWRVISNYDRNGKEVEKGTLEDGNGTLFKYDELGKLTTIEKYHKGKLIESKGK
jgi:hypothetical protein